MTVPTYHRARILNLLNQALRRRRSALHPRQSRYCCRG
jgi:hypothetical protein